VDCDCGAWVDWMMKGTQMLCQLTYKQHAAFGWGARGRTSAASGCT
jgi:hypothetical protein